MRVLLDTTMSGGNDFVSALCLSWVMMIIFCLRFAHLQRSQVAEIASWYWELYVTRGKSRDCGNRRRPFRVRAPRSSVSGLDIAGLARSVLDRICKGRYVPHFFLFDTTPARAKLADIKGFVCRKMSRSKFVGLSAQLFKAPPLAMSSEEVRLCATYWARRLIPW